VQVQILFPAPTYQPILAKLVTPFVGRRSRAAPIARLPFFLRNLDSTRTDLVRDRKTRAPFLTDPKVSPIVPAIVLPAGNSPSPSPSQGSLIHIDGRRCSVDLGRAVYRRGTSVTLSIEHAAGDTFTVGAAAPSSTSSLRNLEGV
jgi:hypothetical protein